MKILVIAPYAMYGNFSNSFIHKQLREVAKLGHHIMCVVPVAFFKKICGKRNKNIITRRRVDGVDIVYLSYISFSKIGKNNFNVLCSYQFFRLLIKRILSGFIPDIVWGHTFLFSEKFGCFIKRKYRCPFVLTTHGGDTELAVMRAQKTRYYSSMIDLIFCVSQKLINHLQGISINCDVKYVNNGFDETNLIINAKKTLSIIQVGHLIESKHFEITLLAVKKLIELGFDFLFHIVGEGEMQNSLQAFCRNNQIDEKVIFHGVMDNKNVLALMSECSYFVMPSYPEGFGIVYLEAMASKCVTIGTLGEGIDGFIKNGINGFLVDKNDYESIVNIIIRCENDLREKESIVNQGYKDAQKCTWKNNATIVSNYLINISSRYENDKRH